MAQKQCVNDQRISVLLVQDADGGDGGMLQLLDELQSPEVAVTVTAALDEALRELSTRSWKVMLIQLDLAGVTVEEIMAAVNRAATGVTVILFGSAEQEGDGISALSLGATDYLVTEALNSRALGRVLRYAAVRTALEAELRESEYRYRILFEHSGTALILVEKGFVTMANASASRLLGLAAGQSTKWSTLLSSEEAERVARLVRRSGQDRPLQLELQVIGRSGETKPVVVNVVALPERETYIVSLVDLTERLKVEQEVRRQREYFRALFENSPEGIIAFDAEGSALDVNPAFERLFGFKRGEIAGKDGISLLVPARFELQAHDILSQSLRVGVQVPYAVRKRSDGSEVMVSILGAPVQIDGRNEGGFGIYRDVTAELQAQERLEEAFIDLVETTVRMMESVDPYTASHQRMVARLADMVGRQMGLDEIRLQGLYIGGLLHDIGKLSLPSIILTKPGILTPQEWALIRSHPRRGYDLLVDAKLPWPVAEMALWHHERLDGSGYPDGMTEEQLSLEVRILGACDAVEAMSSDRPYRPARPIESVLQELNAGSGLRYDSSVAEVLLDIIRTDRFPLEAGYRGYM